MSRERIATYAGTILIFPGADAFSVDLRDGIGAEARAALARAGLTGPFGVVTAHNPLGQTQTAERNAELHRRLVRAVAELRVPAVPVEGASPDLRHSEASLAIPMGQDHLVQLARAFRQDAIFWFDGTRFWLVPAESSFDPTPLPLGGG